MNLEVRPLERSDIAEVVSGWNSCFLHDKVTERRFEKVILEDPNYDTEGNLVAIIKNQIIGFVGAVAREGVTGRDGKGRVHEKDFGYIKGLFVLKDHRGKGIKEQLLGRALNYFRSKGKSVARVGEYTGRYFFPGIDVRYKEELRFYQVNGFEEINEEEDVMLDLKTFQPTEYQKQAQRRIEALGVVIKPYQLEFLDKMRGFVEKISYPQWFPEGWEKDFGKEGCTLVALMENRVVGFAGYPPNPEGGGFGPIAVLEELRGKGIGSCLLLESVLQMKALGTPNVTAGWANTPFYLKNGWKVIRQYKVFQKETNDI